MKAASTLFALLISTQLSFGQGTPAEATPNVATPFVALTADTSVQANVGSTNSTTHSHNSISKKAAAEGTSTVNSQVKAAAVRADGSYTVAHSQTSSKKFKKKKKLKQGARR